ncbi:MAG: D-alanine--D-alanine ligase [Deltaproteobacteria bacterium]|nr:D-alanine--D-alanine ligase [Deltaproteobacteria bacterium]
MFSKQDIKSKKIAVLLGGVSAEREVSLRSGTAVCKALTQAGYNVLSFDPKERSLLELKNESVDLVFNGLHGLMGEDGAAQGVLEWLQIPYTGSGVLCSAICYDKIRTKKLLQDQNVPMARSWVVTENDREEFLQQWQESYLPVIVKPSREGSTIGMTRVFQSEELPGALDAAFEFCDELLVESFIKGIEVTVSVLNGQALPSIEIAPKSGFYDYKSKYTSGMTEYIVPARLPEDVLQKLASTSERVYKQMGCRGAARCDYMVANDKELYFLEVNTLPGLTETSLLPKAAQGKGMSFLELCENLLMHARCDHVLE